MGTVDRSRKKEIIRAIKEIIAGFIIKENFMLPTAE
jgi:hypothetical protein